MTTETEIERCPKCNTIMERVWIRDHESWACPVDAYAYSVDQDDDGGGYDE